MTAKISSSTTRPSETANRSESETKENYSALHTCPECDTDEFLVTEADETYCTECGVVVSDEPLDRSRRWIDSQDGRERERGAPTTRRLHDKGLSTDIGYYRDGKGQWLPNQTRRRFSRLRKWDAQSKTPSKRETSLREGLTEIARLVSALELSDSIHDRAVETYREAWSNDLLPGRSIEAIATGSLFAACRMERLPRHLEEFDAVARVEETDVKNAYKTLNRELNLATPPPLPQDFVAGIVNTVDADETLERRARQLAVSPEIDQVANGRSPSSVAAACLYQAHVEHGKQRIQITQVELAEAAFTTTVTLRSAWEEIRDLVENENLPDPEAPLETSSS